MELQAHFNMHFLFTYKLPICTIIMYAQARSQDFLWGGGGAYLKNRNQIMNVLNDTLC